MKFKVKKNNKRVPGKRHNKYKFSQVKPLTQTYIKFWKKNVTNSIWQRNMRKCSNIFPLFICLLTSQAHCKNDKFALLNSSKWKCFRPKNTQLFLTCSLKRYLAFFCTFERIKNRMQIEPHAYQTNSHSNEDQFARIIPK